jgi:D-alanyl-lipoteichoic acid acyltransferase DltB (MBOAT superfamily)
MLFNSLQFALFLPCVFAIYWCLRRWLKWQNLFVLAASYLFYGWWDWRFLLLIALTSTLSYVSGLLIERGQCRKTAMWSNIAVNIAILGLFKYYDFFTQSFANLFLGGEADHLLLHLILPVGISFYTFQAISYSIDVYRGSVKATHDVVAFFAYVSFFPQLVAGPIERASNLLPQFENFRRFDYAVAVDGLRQMLWGLFKKMVVADTCALYVDKVFAAPMDYIGATLAVAAMLFAIQIYGDFSGYSDVAIGTAKLFGISLRRNFNVPYFSRDIAEFWRRWHISLTSWFRDYVYIPLGGSRVGRWHVVFNTFVIFLLSGFWHGANWTFLAWGFFHALLFLPLILLGKNRRFRDVVASDRNQPSVADSCRMLLTFALVSLGWVLFRSPSIGFAAHYFAHLFGKGATLVPWGGEYTALIPAIVLMFGVEWLNRRGSHEFERHCHFRLLRWTSYALLIFIIVAFMQTNEMPFIYFQF